MVATVRHPLAVTTVRHLLAVATVRRLLARARHPLAPDYGQLEPEEDNRPLVAERLVEVLLVEIRRQAVRVVAAVARRRPTPRRCSTGCARSHTTHATSA